IYRRPESIQVATVTLNPPVVNIMRTQRMLDGKERRDFVVLQNHFALWIEDEADVEETILNFGMSRLRLGHNEGVVGAGNFAQRLGLLTGNIDGSFSGELD